ncbi:glycoside hydrolase family 13 protein [Plantibacter sp. MCCC 1A11337]|uniref:glycoside hydrolase family 13 protein n=1 Tax=Plantibacter TaxID=190323 RepID=UPI000EAE46E2|nr:MULTISPECIES: glycoside hydrolase family 13 protein [unclassified Plantibacter]NUJ86725.1 glycoside hydrolase family 13 protein [Plantibacter sp. MCCC 1A11337]
MTDAPLVDTDTDSADARRTADATWWRQAAVYQIYPRSFADADGDGLGDLPGIRSRVDYLTELGIDAIWLSPFYPSALADGGYDVADYRDVDPRLGTLEDFDELIVALHERGIRVIVDIVPNHTSDLHAWFQEALTSGRGSVARDRYVFREGKGASGEEPPTDWESVFGGPAWERVEDGQWYFHNFATEQPDLNWDHPEVRADFLKTLRFWSDRGVDGFRIDVAHMLTKDLSEPLPSRAELDLMPQDGNHPLLDRDDVHEVYAEWRRVFEEYDPPRTAVAEAWVGSPERRAKYASAEGLGQAFNFDLLEADFDAAEFRTVITDNLAQAAETGSSTTWVLSNHDVTRHATRYGLPPLAGRPVKQGTEWVAAGGPESDIDRDQGLRRARAATLLLLGLPGSTYLYQGEELGLQEVAAITAEQRQDPAFFRGGEYDGLGRDGCRVPLPWSAQGPSFGFGGAVAHLPQPTWFAEYAVDVEAADPNSTLSLYREALRLRRLLQTEERLEWIETGRPDVVRFVRPNGWQVLTNFGTEPFPLEAEHDAVVLGSLQAGSVPGESTVWTMPGVLSE